MFKYDPPASADDLAGRPTRAAFLDAWHQRINQSFTTEINGRHGPVRDVVGIVRGVISGKMFVAY
jgi:hypothetical protein